ncbi:MAG: hypothetical protein HY465_03700, partial [Deltaproteobacteria bacterium]|nr:hypothetical protein [Deltaproteobacteria bacterium]
MKRFFFILILILVLMGVEKRANARPCLVNSDADRYTLDQEEPEFTLRDYLWIIQQAWREESRDRYGNRLVNPYYNFCRDGTNERGKAIRRLLLTHDYYLLQSPLPPLVVGEGETLIIESESDGHSILDGTSISGRDDDCGLYLGLDAERLWREAAGTAPPNASILAGWREDLSGENILLQNFGLRAFPNHAVCIGANRIQLSQLRIFASGDDGLVLGTDLHPNVEDIQIEEVEFLYNEGAAVEVTGETTHFRWEGNRMWENEGGGFAVAGRRSGENPVVEEIIEEFDGWKITGRVPETVARPYLIQTYLQNPNAAQTHPEGVLLLQSAEFSSRQFTLTIPKERENILSYGRYNQLPFYSDLDRSLQALAPSHYPFTLLLMDHNGTMVPFAEPFRPEDYLSPLPSINREQFLRFVEILRRIWRERNNETPAEPPPSEEVPPTAPPPPPP